MASEQSITFRLSLGIALALGILSANANAARAQSISCATVKWALATLPKSVIDGYMKTATPAQLAAGRACLRGEAVAPQRVTQRQIEVARGVHKQAEIRRARARVIKATHKYRHRK